jgi:hypothetical protein
LEKRRMRMLKRLLLVCPWRMGKMTLVELHVPGPTQAELQTRKSGFITITTDLAQQLR